MNISVFGMGYVGAVTSACFAELGFRVIGVDIDQKILDRINAGRAPIVEKGLDLLIQSGLRSGLLRTTTSAREAVAYLLSRGLKPEQQLEVVVANGVEVPVCALVGRHRGLPARIVVEIAGDRQQLVKRGVIGDVGDRQALRREPHAGASRVLERAPVAADAEVVGDAIDGQQLRL